MIKKILSNKGLQVQINQKVTRHFGGGGGHDHPIHLDTKANWVENKDFDADLVAIYGWKEAHDHHHGAPADPYYAVRGQPLLSFRRMYFTDAFYTADEDEPLMNEPHGYLSNDDPMDTRNSIERPVLEWTLLASIVTAMGLAVGYNSLNLDSVASDLYNMDATASLIEDEMRKIRIDNSILEKKKTDLLAKLKGDSNDE